MHQFLFYSAFIIHLYMFRAQLYSSSGDHNCITQHLASPHSAGGRPMHRLGPRPNLCIGQISNQPHAAAALLSLDDLILIEIVTISKTVQLLACLESDPRLSWIGMAQEWNAKVFTRPENTLFVYFFMSRTAAVIYDAQIKQKKMEEAQRHSHLRVQYTCVRTSKMLNRKVSILKKEYATRLHHFTLACINSSVFMLPHSILRPTAI